MFTWRRVGAVSTLDESPEGGGVAGADADADADAGVQWAVRSNKSVLIVCTSSMIH